MKLITDNYTNKYNAATLSPRGPKGSSTSAIDDIQSPPWIGPNLLDRITVCLPIIENITAI